MNVLVSRLTADLGAHFLCELSTSVIISVVVTNVNASWHVCLTCQLLKLLCDNSNCKGVIMIKVNICSL